MSKENQLLNIIAEILEIDAVSPETELNEENWDSLAVVTFISEVDSNFEQVLSPTSVNKASTVQDLLELVK
ncbi:MULTISPECIES: acyl carrier protein [Providencia]|uniref:acyl carrier protein n=1 Tax=Providencia TaxID=586 RepID=UPI000F7717C5|nr:MULTISPECIES: acyl carrier protein [Providencia]EJD6378463.1 acyl carrier protein [Providencia rettgeri]EJD6585108.1 acyl carrier protein [Providencia rettgeri]MBQ0343541.1 acyl carrier protein [Providencia rettgeri]MBV2188992.1 acyl carrier protein [Providencia rettgeri]QNP21740.1 acyl carrier protein [Providencia rettgeri]